MSSIQLKSAAKYIFFTYMVVIFCKIPTLSKSENTAKEGSFLCRRCGETISNAENLREIPSKLAHTSWNQTLSNKKKMYIQLFENPNDVKFRVVTFANAEAKVDENAVIEASWFPDFAWRISQCPRCGHHIGWKFQPVNFNHLTVKEEETFFGLILDNLLLESEADNLLINPHLHQS